MTDIQKQKIYEVCKKNNFYFCVFFGSGADEKIKKYQRDIDLAFYAGKRIPTKKSLEIYQELMPHFDKEIDVVLIQPLMDPLLAYEISVNGKCVCELKEDSFLEFQTRAWKDYLDSQRYRDYEKKYIERKVKNVS